MRESRGDKARRYLIEGRIIITHVNRPVIRATARGDGALYRVSHSQTGWTCNCPARSTCAHITAVGMVTVGSWTQTRGRTGVL